MSRRLLLSSAAAALVLWGCGGPEVAPGTHPGVHGHTPRAGGGDALPDAFQPERAGATHYQEDRPSGVAVDPFASAVYLAIADHLRATGRTPPAYDARLERAARDLARGLDAEGAPGYHDIVDFVLRHHGIVEAFPQVVVLGVDTDDVHQFRVGFANQAARAAREGQRLGCGVAPRADGGQRLVMLYLPGVLRVEPVPRAAAVGAIAEVRGHVLDTVYADPRVIVTHASGIVRQAEGVREDRSGEDPLSFAVDVPFDDGAGRYDVEVVADGPHGPAVLGLMRVYAGMAPPDGIAGRKPTPEVTTLDGVQAELLRLVNKARRDAGLQTLEWRDDVAAVALGHSRDMVAADFVGHISPSTGTPIDRVAKARLPATAVRENIGRSYSADDIHHGLMSSPGHRDAILDPTMTHSGIGVVADRGPDEPTDAYVVTELFVRIEPSLAPNDAAAQVVARVNAARVAAGLGALKVDPDLGGVAMGACERHMTRGLTPGETTQSIDTAVQPLFGARFTKLATLLSVLPSLEQVDRAPPVKDPKFDTIGAGAWQGRHPSDGEGTCVVLLLGTRR